MEMTYKIAAIMTAPRFEITWVRNQITRSLAGVGIPLTVSGGVFYGQCMQLMLEDLVRQGADYAVTIDFDSLFSANDLRRLLHWCMDREDIDAIAGMQARRGKKVMLGTAPGGEQTGPDEKTIQWDGKPIQATTAHFGLTVIDLRKLATVPKPWFWAQPNADGSWEGNKTDDDVYFWFKWKEAGHSVYIDPGVRLGHVEEMVSIHDEKMNVQHIYPQDWERAHQAG